MKRVLILGAILCALGLSTSISAADCEVATSDCYNVGASMSSGHFRILDLQHSAFGGTSSSSSSSFRLIGSIGDLAIGISSNSMSLQLKSGFLYFPLIVSPNPTSAAPGLNQVTVSWSPLRAGLQTDGGLINQGYRVCYRSTGSFVCVPGTPTATSPYVIGSLNAGTLYHFKIQAYDFYGNLISESEEISATPLGIPTPTPTPHGGGGGGGGTIIPPTSVILTGLAFPFGSVHIMFNGVEIATTPTDGNAVFQIDRGNLPVGTANFGFWGTDRAGRRSVTWSFAVPLTGSLSSTRVTGLIVPPTLEVSTTSVQPGTPITVRGESVPGATVEVLLTPNERSISTIVSTDGSYSVQVPTSGLSPGVYDVKARVLLLPASDESTWSQTIQLGIGVPAPQGCNHPPDVNHDGRIDLVDFSIMAFWWSRAVDASNASDVNCDLRVDLADFSILAYNWTGR